MLRNFPLIFIAAAFLFACVDSVDQPRFPSFEELVSTNSMSLEDPATWDEQLDLVSRLSFSEQEIATLFESTKVDDLIVVYLQAHFDDPRRIEALEKALSLDEVELPLAFLLVNHCSYPAATETYSYCDRAAFEALGKLDPENMVSHYILASYSALIGDKGAALNYLRQGNALSKYDIYSSSYFSLITDKAISFGFPKYAAQTNAFGGFIQTMHTTPWFSLCESDLNDAYLDIYAECIEMGRNIEAQSKTYLEKSFGISLQRYGLEGQGAAETEIRKLEARREEMQNEISQVHKFPSKYQTEEMWDQFYVELFDIGEIAAFGNLASRISVAITSKT